MNLSGMPLTNRGSETAIWLHFIAMHSSQGPLEMFYILNVLALGTHSFNHYRVWLAFHGRDWLSSFDAFLLCRVKVNLTDSHFPIGTQLLTHNSFLMLQLLMGYKPQVVSIWD